jgi:hypothetical protein
VNLYQGYIFHQRCGARISNLRCAVKRGPRVSFRKDGGPQRLAGRGNVSSLAG